MRETTVVTTSPARPTPARQAQRRQPAQPRRLHESPARLLSPHIPEAAGNGDASQQPPRPSAALRTAAPRGSGPQRSAGQGQGRAQAPAAADAGFPGRAHDASCTPGPAAQPAADRHAAQTGAVGAPGGRAGPRPLRPPPAPRPGHLSAERPLGPAQGGTQAKPAAGPVGLLQGRQPATSARQAGHAPQAAQPAPASGAQAVPSRTACVPSHAVQPQVRSLLGAGPGSVPLSGFPQPSPPVPAVEQGASGHRHDIAGPQAPAAVSTARLLSCAGSRSSQLSGLQLPAAMAARLARMQAATASRSLPGPALPAAPGMACPTRAGPAAQPAAQDLSGRLGDHQAAAGRLQLTGSDAAGAVRATLPASAAAAPAPAGAMAVRAGLISSRKRQLPEQSGAAGSAVGGAAAPPVKTPRSTLAASPADVRPWHAIMAACSPWLCLSCCRSARRCSSPPRPSACCKPLPSRLLLPWASRPSCAQRAGQVLQLCCCAGLATVHHMQL